MTLFSFRIIHRYLGFFLAGVMLVYAVSGFALIFRDTDFLKTSQQVEVTLDEGLNEQELSSALKIKKLKVSSTDGNIATFQAGTYNTETGIANYTKTELPDFLTKLNRIHKATTEDPLYWLNIFFALSLAFFSISTFWMFKPKTMNFKKGMIVAAIGITLTIALIYLP